jgi:hypothetical protein
VRVVDCWLRNEKQVPPLRRRVRSGSGRNDRGFYAMVAAGQISALGQVAENHHSWLRSASCTEFGRRAC